MRPIREIAAVLWQRLDLASRFRLRGSIFGVPGASMGRGRRTPDELIETVDFPVSLSRQPTQALAASTIASVRTPMLRCSL